MHTTRHRTFAGATAVSAAALLAMSGAAFAQDASPSTDMQDGSSMAGQLHPIHIHAGTCENLGDVIFPLGDISTDLMVHGEAVASMTDGQSGDDQDASANTDEGTEADPNADPDADAEAQPNDGEGAVEDAADAVGEAATDAQDAAQDAAGDVQDAAQDVQDEAQDAQDEAQDAADDMRHGETLDQNIALNVTAVDASISDLTAENHSINIHQSADAMDVYIACGDIGGTVIEDDTLVIRLDEQSDSNYVGVALLKEGEDGNTVVYSMLTQKDDDVQSPAPDPTPTPEPAESPAADGTTGDAEATDDPDITVEVTVEGDPEDVDVEVQGTDEEQPEESPAA